MKHTFKYLFIAMTVAATALCMTACGDNDDGNANDEPQPPETETTTKDQLVGVWQSSDELVTTELVFNTNGSFNRQSWKNDYPEYHEEFAGTYSISDKRLTLTGVYTHNSAAATILYDFSLSNGVLTLELVSEEPYVEIFHRIK